MSTNPFEYNGQSETTGDTPVPPVSPSAPSAYSAPPTAPYGTPVQQPYAPPMGGQAAPAAGAYVPPGVNQPMQAAPAPGAQPAMPGAANGYVPQAGAYTPAQKQESFFSALFDMSFSKYITVTWAKIVYITTVVGIVLGWLGGAIMLGTLGGLDFYDPGFSGGWFFAGLIFGVVPAFLQLMFVRVLLEFAAATIRNEQNTRVLADVEKAKPAEENTEVSEA